MSPSRRRWRALEWTWAACVLVFLTGAARHWMVEPSLAGGALTPGQIVVAAYLAVTAAVLARVRRDALPVAARSWPILLLPVLALASTLWSEAPAPTFRRAVSLAGTAGFGLLLAVRFTLAEQVRLVALALAVTIGASAAAALLFPEYGLMTGEHAGAWQGLFFHKNLLGRPAALAALAFLFLALGSDRWRPPALLGLAGSIAVVAASGSRTALLAGGAAGAVALVLALVHRLPPARRGRALAVAGGAGLVLLAVLAWRADEALALIGRDATLTNRTRIWSAALDALAERPLLGYGYHAFWRSDAAARIGARIGWEPQHAHNGFLDVGLELGVAGAALFLAPFLYYLGRALAAGRAAGALAGWWPFVYLSYYALANLAESPLVRQHTLGWALYVATVGTLVRRPAPAAGRD